MSNNPWKKYLFSYGSNHTEQLGERIGCSIRGHSAYVDGMGRAFRGHSNRWNGGVATLIPPASAQTFGYVTEITDEELDQLDQFEGVPRNYRREHIHVMMRKGNQFVPVMATVYLSNSTQKNSTQSSLSPRHHKDPQ